MKVLVATQKPFAKAAVDGIRAIVEKAGYELVLLEKYETPEELYAAVADVDAMIVRSDKVTAQVIDAAKNLKWSCALVPVLTTSTWLPAPPTTSWP